MLHFFFWLDAIVAVVAAVIVLVLWIASSFQYQRLEWAAIFSILGFIALIIGGLEGWLLLIVFAVTA